jgi:hypothetical protein
MPKKALQTTVLKDYTEGVLAFLFFFKVANQRNLNGE